MSTQTPARRPAGSPAGGQFAPNGHAESDLDLADAPDLEAAGAHMNGMSEAEVPMGCWTPFSAALDAVDQVGRDTGTRWDVTSAQIDDKDELVVTAYCRELNGTFHVWPRSDYPETQRQPIGLRFVCDDETTDGDPLEGAVESELAWLIPGLASSEVLRVAGLARRHGSIEGNAVYALSRLGYADDPRTHQLVDSLLDWQWPDGGWNCDRRRDAWRSSFHESAIPALGLAAYARVTAPWLPGRPPGARPSCCSTTACSGPPPRGSRYIRPGRCRTTRPRSSTWPSAGPPG